MPLLALATASACRRVPNEGAPAPSASSARPPASIGPPEKKPAPRQGMVWIPGGALVAGTPLERLPRVADAEMPGQQVIVHGFYIDVFPYPNEEGAIPLTNVSQPEAARLCAERGKRLCSELEWERACKGPSNQVYEYGDSYRPDRCGTGVLPGLRPSGLRVGCRSDYGVRDLHGGAFEWTLSPWGRGTSGDFDAVRGGNGTAGEIVGRCANGEPRATDSKSGALGFRCCAGDANAAEVFLPVKRGASLEALQQVEPARAARLLALLPETARSTLQQNGTPKLERGFIWRPVGNEELFAAAICAGFGTRPACGTLIARDDLGKATFVGWAPTGYFPPSLHVDRDPRDLWLLGGDELGPYKRLVAYAWGRVTVHGEERRVGRPDPDKKKKKKKKLE